MASYLKQRLAELDPPFPINVIPYGGESYETLADSEETNSLPDEMDVDVPDVELICKGEVPLDFRFLFQQTSPRLFRLG